MKKRKQPKSEFVKFFEAVNNVYKLYKENEFWIDPLINAIRNYNQQQRLKNYQRNLQFPVPIKKRRYYNRPEVKLNSNGKVPNLLVILE